jgi:hypothetical protein
VEGFRRAQRTSRFVCPRNGSRVRARVPRHRPRERAKVGVPPKHFGVSFWIAPCDAEADTCGMKERCGSVAIGTDACPAVLDLVAIFEGLPVGPACAKLELWRYAYRRSSTRPPPKGSP